MDSSDVSDSGTVSAPNTADRHADDAPDTTARLRRSDGSYPVLTCLIVSENDSVRTLLESMLRVRRHLVNSCDLEGMATIDIEQLNPHLAVVDWRLPDNTANDLLRRIRGDGSHTSHCQVLAIVDADSGPEVSTILAAGVADVLTEPLETTAVEMRIRVSEQIAAEFQRLEQAYAELNLSHERLLISCGGTDDGLWDADLRHGVVTLSPEWEGLVGFEVDRHPTVDAWLELVDEQDRDRIRQLIESVSRGELQSLEERYRLICDDGGRRPMLMRGETVRDGSGEVERLVCRHSELTTDGRSYEEPRSNLLVDPLTRLASRTVLLDRLRHAFARASRMQDKPFAVLFFDIDRFKNVNDSLGHLVGDKLLVSIAERVRSICRPSDTVCRFGGDEFVIVAEDVESVRDATSIAGRLHQEFQVPFILDGSEVYATVSTGIAMWHSGYEKPENLLRDADNAMYRAKDLGRNRYAVFDKKMHAEVVATLELENDLRRAVSRKEFRPFYQPIISLKRGNLVGFEVLARWDHPTRGLVSPGVFIQVAEEMGIAVQIDRIVAEEACRQLRPWQVQFRIEPPITISLNISTTQFLQLELVSRIDHTLRQNGLYGRDIKLEVTESVLMENTEHATAMLDQLAALDIGLSIDDFGTGYSSLAYLKRFEIDSLKIDYSFVSRMVDDMDSMEIVRTIIDLGRNLGKTTIAEGVETDAQLEALRKLGVDQVQGFYIARPMPAEDATELLDRIHLSRNHLQTILVDRLCDDQGISDDQDISLGED
jgi:diguanylate cyclase (GGDEF)-like protein/PAS domain S-box-containing protein